MSTSEKDGKGWSPVPSVPRFQVTRDELLGQQLPRGDHREQNRHVAGRKAVGTSVGIGGCTSSVCVDWAMGQRISGSWKMELQVKALRKLVIVSNDCAFDFSQV